MQIIPAGYVIEETIDFEVLVSTSLNKKGGVEIKVLTGNISKEDQSIQTVAFSVINEADKKKIIRPIGQTLIELYRKGDKAFVETFRKPKAIQKTRRLTGILRRRRSLFMFKRGNPIVFKKGNVSALFVSTLYED